VFTVGQNGDTVTTRSDYYRKEYLPAWGTTHTHKSQYAARVVITLIPTSTVEPYL